MIDGLLAFYKGLIALGISEADIVQMSQTNPAKLLGAETLIAEIADILREHRRRRQPQ